MESNIVRFTLFRTKVFLRSLLGEWVWAMVQRLSMAPRHRLARLVQRETGRVVLGGPFRGVHYLHDAVSGGYIPKLLGIYERELHPIIALLPQQDIRYIVNIGASDGYYAVGLARLLPASRVIAYEMEPRGQDFVRIIADRNGVGDRVVVHGRCELATLKIAVADLERVLVVCDVEGYEDVLLDPDEIPSLRLAWILVELHDGKNPGVSSRIRLRFEKSHTITRISQQRRTASEFPFSSALTRSLSPK